MLKLVHFREAMQLDAYHVTCEILKHCFSYVSHVIRNQYLSSAASKISI